MLTVRSAEAWNLNGFDTGLIALQLSRVCDPLAAALCSGSRLGDRQAEEQSDQFFH